MVIDIKSYQQTFQQVEKIEVNKELMSTKKVDRQVSRVGKGKFKKSREGKSSKIF